MNSVTECDMSGSDPVGDPSPLRQLYLEPHDAARPIKLKVVLAADMPRWIAGFIDLTDAEKWIEVSVHAAGKEFDASGADVLLAIGPRALANRLAGQPGHLCWWLDPSLVDLRDPPESLMLPMLRGETATVIELQLVSDGVPPICLARSAFSTQFGWPKRQVARGGNKLQTLLLRGLRHVAHGGHRSTGKVETLRLAGSEASLGFGLSIWLATLSMANLARKLWARRSRKPPWVVAVRNDVTPLDPHAPTVDLPTFLVAPDGGYWADPCAVKYNGHRYLFVEEVTSSCKRGVITCLELIDKRVAKKLGVVLDEPGHLSYPQPFLWEGQWYMTVESGEARRISLYQAQEFPFRWSRRTDLLVGYFCADPTMHYHNGCWYLFANVVENGGSDWDELFLFVSDSLAGPFIPHPANPVVSDVRSARCAGRLFEHNGRLIRPAQDCSRCYGSAVVFNEVLELSPSCYHERSISRLDPSWVPGIERCHTYNRADGLELLDAVGNLDGAAQRVFIEGAAGA